MKIEELSVISFGAVRLFTVVPDRCQNTPWEDGGGNRVPTAAFLTFIFYGKLPPSLLAPDTLSHGVLTAVKNDGRPLCIERKTVTDREGVRSDTLSVTDPDTNEPFFCERALGEELFGINASTFELLFELDANRPLSAQNADACRILLGLDAKKERFAHAVRRIDEAASSLLRPNQRGGAIYELEKKQAELEKKIADSNQASNRTAAIESSLCHAEEQRKEACADLQKLLELDSAYGNLSLIREYDELHALENSLDKQRRTYDAFLEEHRVGTFLPTEEYKEEIDRQRLTVLDAIRSYAEARAAFNALEFTEEEDEHYAVHLETVRKKYGHFGRVRDVALTLSRRAAHAAVFSCLSLFAAAIFAVGTLLTHTENPQFSFALLVLSLCFIAAAPVLLFSRRHFANALLLLCREYGTKNRSELFERLQFLEKESLKRSDCEKKLTRAKTVFEDIGRTCADAFDRLNAATAQWGRKIDPAHVGEDLDLLLADIQTFLDADRDLRARIVKKEHAVALARKALSNQSEIAVRALVSPTKRENLRQLEKEDRMREIAHGIAFYRHQIEKLDERIAELHDEHAEFSARIGEPHQLCKELDELTARINSLRALYDSYLLAKDALLAAEKTQKETNTY